MAEIGQLIISSPYEMPTEHWKWNESSQDYNRVSGRRSAGYTKATKTDDKIEHGIFVEIKLVNRIRKEVDKWRDANYRGITNITRDLLDHWKDPDVRNDQLFFCQLEAIETLIWIMEINDPKKTGISIPKDGGEFKRLCSKMATGTGKTIVMAMVIVWQTLNKIAKPNDGRFSKYFLIVAPGITVKSRLQVLWPPESDESYYRRYSLVPDSYRNQLKEAKVKIHNWHTFMHTIDEHSVTQKGPIDNETFAKEVLEHNYKNMVIINDEAHHAWRKKKTVTRKAARKEEQEDENIATQWIGGLDKIHKAREINMCFDFTATPFMPSGKAAMEEDVYKWVVSDFSLNDAIEAGLVKTPRMPAGDDGKELATTDKSKYYHLYEHKDVKADLNSKTGKNAALPDLVRNAYMLLAKDWERTKKSMQGTRIPPVMITVCNNKLTAARVINFFKNDPYDFNELENDLYMRRIDTDMLRKERGEKKMSEDDEMLRETINTVGQLGKAGEQIRNIIAVKMLSEGWDAKNVTQIMGLRAFSSQLLCEQVVGRGLRRRSYDTNEHGMFNVEYVNIIGVPFSFIPHQKTVTDIPEKTKTLISVDLDNAMHEISWPNVGRINTTVRSDLQMDWNRVKTLKIDARKHDVAIYLAPMLDLMPVLNDATKLDMENAYKNLRMQTIIFHAVRDICKDFIINGWNGDRYLMFAQIAKITEKFIDSNKISIINLSDKLEIRRHLALLFNMKAVVTHIRSSIQSNNVKSKEIIFGFGKQTRSTRDFNFYNTTKKTLDVKKSHINPSPYDNDWEKKASKELEDNSRVKSWVKNDRLGFMIKYQHDGVIRNYIPDYIVRLDGGPDSTDIMLILEIKGREAREDKSKYEALEEWVETVNRYGRFGTWMYDVAREPDDVARIIRQHSPKRKANKSSPA